MSNIGWVLGALVVGWVLQLALAWRQARRFYAGVAQLRRQGGRVAVGVGRRRYRRTYVALAVRGVTVTDALVLAGATVLATARPEPRLVGRRISELAGGRPVAGLPEGVRAGAEQAAGFLAAKDVPAQTPAR